MGWVWPKTVFRRERAFTQFRNAARQKNIFAETYHPRFHVQALEINHEEGQKPKIRRFHLARRRFQASATELKQNPALPYSSSK